ncbi:MAG: PTS mannose transporter subunit IID [Gemmatimonadetes bacterium]|nr:PTS mannose transporter subunit IID [Gemmatimonadota bacterium]
MSEALARGVVVAHGELAAALVAVVSSISGVEDGLRAVSNDGLGADGLRERVTAAVGTDPTIIFVDLKGGSCGLAGLAVAKGASGVAVLTGVNVPMLLDFVFHRDLPLDALVERLVEKGRAELCAYESASRSG